MQDSLNQHRFNDKQKAPAAMARPGAAVIDGEVAYFMEITGDLYSYNTASNQWSEKLSTCPYESSSLAVIKGHIGAVGGEKTRTDDMKEVQLYFRKSKKRLLVNFNIRDKDLWVKDWLQEMPTRRHSAAAAQTKTHLIVAGGKDQLNCLDIVELMTIDSDQGQWSTAASLPHSYFKASATICGDYIYMLGGNDSTGYTKSVLACSLNKLIKSSEISSGTKSVWKRIKEAPAYYSTCLARKGELLAVGGTDEEGKTTAAVYRYISITDTWYLTDVSMKSPSYHRLIIVIPSTERVIAVGGKIVSPSSIVSLIDDVETMY